MNVEHEQGDGKAGQYCQSYVYPPKDVHQDWHPGAIPRGSNQHCAVDDGAKCHGNAAQKHGDGAMAEHPEDHPGMHGIAGDAEAHKCEEQQQIQEVECDGDLLQSSELVRQCVEKDGDDACAHVDREP